MKTSTRLFSALAVGVFLSLGLIAVPAAAQDKGKETKAAPAKASHDAGHDAAHGGHKVNRREYIVMFFVLVSWQGWTLTGPVKHGIIPAEIRQQPGGYRSYHSYTFWRGGK